MKIELKLVEEILEQYRKKVIDNPDIGQQSEKIMMATVDSIQSLFHSAAVEKATRVDQQKEDPEMMLVPLFKSASNEINIMSRLEFLMSHASACDELNQEEQFRIANWFASKYGEKLTWG